MIPGGFRAHRRITAHALEVARRVEHRKRTDSLIRQAEREAAMSHEHSLASDDDTDSELPKGPAWVSTPTGEQILAGLRYAQLAADIVVIYGGAGLGKTCAIRHYRTISPQVFHVEMSPTTGSLRACLEEIALAMGLPEYSHRPVYLHRGICAQLRKNGGLLVIDEAQELGMPALDQVRCIHDQAKVGVALVGNERIYTQLAGTQRAAYLDRLYSRIGKRIHLKRSTGADADALLKAWKIDDPACRARVRLIASKPGALRVLTKTLRLAALYAQAEGREIEGEDIEVAWQDLGGLD